jgi:hypothetical protein
MHETTQITYGDGTITVIMNSESLTEVAAPDIRFGSYNKALKACFTAKELEEISAGADAEVTFDFVMRDTLEDKSEEKSFDKAIATEEKNHGVLHKGVFYDVEAAKSIDGEEPIELNGFYEEVEVQFEIPLYLVAEDRYYYIMTDEMGVCSLEADVDEEADTLSVSTDGIGTTLMLYQTEEESLIDNDHSLHIQSHYLIIGGIVLLAVAWLVIDRYNKKG